MTFYSPYFPGRFYGGFITYPNEGNLGGGVRVSSIKTTSNQNVKEVKYTYNKGTTSTLPFGLIPVKTGKSVYNNTPEHRKKEYEKYIQENSYFLYSDIFKNSREIPPPGVLYGQVEVQGYVDGKPVPSYETYEFETFQAGMVGFKTDLDYERNVYDYNYTYDEKRITNQQIRRISKKDFSARVGSLKRLTVKNTDGDLLHETINHYLHDELSYPTDPSDKEYFDVNASTYTQILSDKFNNQGLIEETFADGRLVPVYSEFNLLGIESKVERYPSVQTGTTTTNHRTGITSTTRNLAFDYYSGQVSEFYQEDSYGNKIATKTIPAYHTYPSMKARNMLTQEGETYVFKMGEGFDPETYSFDHNDQLGSLRRSAVGLVSGTFQSWSTSVDVMDGDTRYPSSSVYRKHKRYVNTSPRNSRYGIRQFNNDGTFYIAIGDGFIPSFEIEDGYANPSLGWEEQSEITLYDVNSHALEAKDINGNFVSTRFDRQNERVIAAVANARYEGFTASGFESFGEGDVLFSSSNSGDGLSASRKHSGLKSARLGNAGAKVYFRITDDEKLEYEPHRISFWSNNQSGPPPKLYYKINGGSEVNLTFQYDIEKSVLIDGNRWYLNTAMIAPPENFTSYEIGVKYHGGTVWVDDFRFHPMDATMTSYAYNEWGELSDILDANNLFTHYEYDTMGRLSSVSRETFSNDVVKVSDASIYYGTLVDPSSNLFGVINAESTTNNRTYLSIDFAEDGSGNYEYKWEIEGASPRNTEKDRYPFYTSNTFKGVRDVKVTVTDKVTGLKFTTFQKDVLFNYCPTIGWVGEPFCETDDSNETICFTGNIVRRWSLGGCRFETRPYNGPTTITCPDTCSDTCPPGQDCAIIEN